MGFSNVGREQASELSKALEKRATDALTAAEVAKLDIAKLAEWNERLEQADAAILASANMVADELRARVDALETAPPPAMQIQTAAPPYDDAWARLSFDAVWGRLTALESRPEPKPPRIDLSPYALRSQVAQVAANVASLRNELDVLDKGFQQEINQLRAMQAAAEYKTNLLLCVTLVAAASSLLSLWLWV